METTTAIANRFHVSDTHAHQVFDRCVKMDRQPLTDAICIDEVHLGIYNQYINYVDKYFPNAVPVVNSFHVIQWLIRLIDNYIRQLLKKFRQRDKERKEQLSYQEQRPISLPPSDEVYLLHKYRWLILSNQSNIKYLPDPRIDSHFRCLMNIYDYEDALFRIDPKLKYFRDLKEKYISFNSRNAGKPIESPKKIRRTDS